MLKSLFHADNWREKWNGIMVRCIIAGFFVSLFLLNQPMRSHAASATASNTAKASSATTTSKLNYPTEWYSCLDGEFMVITWNEVTGAVAYDVSVDKNTYNRVNENSIMIPYDPSAAGGTGSLMARSVGAGGKTSGWVSVDYEIPSILYKDIDYREATCLSVSQLKKWAEVKGYKIETSKKDALTVVSVSFKDVENNKISHWISRGITGLIVGGTQSVKESWENTTLLSKMINGFLSGDNIKERVRSGISEGVEEVKDSAKDGGVHGAISYAFMDTDIHYIYYFETKCEDYSALYGEASFMTLHREDHETKVRENFEKTEDGIYYYISSTFGREIDFEISEDKSNPIYTRWNEFIVPLYE